MALFAVTSSYALVMDNLIISLATALAGTVIAYYLAYVIYNLWFHPLSHIPGHILARATYIPEFYFDVLRSGRYTRRIQSMHESYGPIVRISPNEVHCCDRRFIETIYAGGNRKRDKPIHQVRGSGVAEQSSFSTTDHDTHRMRRAALAKFFSRAQVSRLETDIRLLAHLLCDKILHVGKRKPFDVTTAYSLFTTDVISGICFGQRLGLVEQPGWEPNFREPLYAQLKLVYWFRFIPQLKRMGVAMAMLTRRLSEDMETLFSALIVCKNRSGNFDSTYLDVFAHKPLVLKVDMPNYVKKAKDNVDRGIDDGKTVFGSILTSDLPDREKGLQRLTEEGFSLFAAGTETVSWTLSVITYHLLRRADIMQRITTELTAASEAWAINQDDRSDDAALPPWAQLEKLPYFGAVIHEGLRLSYGLATRTARVPTGEDLVYHGSWSLGGQEPKTFSYIIPRGYAIGMSAGIAHHDEDIYPDSHAFLPERWIDENNQHRKELDRALLAFSKGSRGCVGINLAYCELYTLLAVLVLRVFPRMKLYKTTQADVAYDHDFFNPFPVWHSKGVRAVIE